MPEHLLHRRLSSLFRPPITATGGAIPIGGSYRYFGDMTIVI
jgi:hypothetical protein